MSSVGSSDGNGPVFDPGSVEAFARFAELEAQVASLRKRNEELAATVAGFQRRNDQLQRLNDDLNNLLNSTEVGTVFVDRELRVRKFNPAIQQIFPLRPLDIGQPIDHVALHLAGREQMLEGIRNVVATGEPLQNEVQLHNGSWLLRRVLPFVTARGVIDGVVLTFTDITEIKSTQDRLSLAMESTRLVWWDADMISGKVVTAATPEPLLGFHPGNMPKTGEEWQALIHPEDKPMVDAAMLACAMGHANDWSVEHRVRTAAGQWNWILNCGKIVQRSPHGLPQRIIGTAQDIHMRRSIAETVHRDAELFAQIQDAIICSDRAGQVTTWNRGAEIIFGWSAEEAIGQPIANYLPEFARSSGAQILSDPKAGHQFSGEWESDRRDGSKVWCLWRARSLGDHEGRAAGMVVVATDVSERRRVEDEHRQLEGQLLQAQKMEIMGTLAGGVAHDFNNLLAAILINTELSLGLLAEESPARSCLDDVLRAGQRAKELVGRILSFSRFQEPERRPLDLRVLIEETAQFVRATLPATVEIRLNLNGDYPPTLADPNQFLQIILNLCSNAAQAMHHRGVLTLTLGESRFVGNQHTQVGELKPGHYLTVSVADTGHGIDQETLRRIFDPFFTTKKSGEGTGLGLSIVRGILQGHGGSIDVASMPGCGSIFKIYLPVLSTAGVHRDNKSQSGARPVRGRGERVMVVDDEPSIANVTSSALRNLGYEAVAFTTVEDFRRAFDADPSACSLLITDQIMPRQTGMELAHQLRAQGYRVPVLITTGFGGNLNNETVAEVSPSGLLKKPYELRDFAGMVRRLLDESAAYTKAVS